MLCIMIANHLMSLKQELKLKETEITTAEMEAPKQQVINYPRKKGFVYAGGVNDPKLPYVQ